MRTLALTAVLGLPLAGCVTNAHETLNGTAWVQTSPEYVMACAQTYVSAARQLEGALADKGTSAALEQNADFAELPPAIILDVDETVLDNSPFQAWTIEQDADFEVETWDAWCQEAIAEPVPGVKGFLAAARSKDIEVFYVTNRDVKHEFRTLINLRNTVDPTVTPDKILCKNENGWTSDKTSRRMEVAKTHRILMLFGDDCNDFTYLGRNASPAQRIETARNHAAQWGKRWFLLPNPIYGSWERALWGYDYSLSRPGKVRRKREALRFE